MKRAVGLVIGVSGLTLIAALLLAHVGGGPRLDRLGGVLGGHASALGGLVVLAAWCAVGALMLLSILRLLGVIVLALRLHYAPGARVLRLVNRRGVRALLILSGAGASVASTSVPAAFAASAPHTTTSLASLPGQRSAARHAARPWQRPARSVYRPVPKERALVYTVQVGETAMSVAEHLCGSPRAFAPIVHASRAIRQEGGRHIGPDGAAVPGERLRIPLRLLHGPLADERDTFVYTVQDGDSLAGIAARFLGTWRAYTDVYHRNAGLAQPDGGALGDPALIQPGWRLHIPLVTTAYRVPAIRQHGLRPAPLKGGAWPLTQHDHTARRPAPRPTLGSRGAPHRSSPIDRLATRLPSVPTTSPVRAPIHDLEVRGERPLRTAPTVRFPTGQIWPVGLALVFAGALALVARRRLDGTLGTPPVTLPPGERLTGGMRRTLGRLRQGATEDETVIRERMETGPGNKVAALLAALELADLPIEAVTLVWERRERVSLLLADRPVPADDRRRLPVDIASRVGAALGVTVTAERVHDPVTGAFVLLGVPQGPVSADACPALHPLPLLVPVGRVADDEVLHVNLAGETGTLIAGGAYGAESFVGTLLASVVSQAAPTQVRLLVASGDPSLRENLPVVPHLAAPAVDAGDPAARRLLLQQTEAVVLERFHAGVRAPAYLVVLDGIETLADEDIGAVDLDALCRQGPESGVYVLATTGAPDGIPAGVLEALPVRIARQLTGTDSTAFLGSPAAVDLPLTDALLHGLGADYPFRPFGLGMTEVRQVCATVALAHAPVPPTPPEGWAADVDEADVARTSVALSRDVSGEVVVSAISLADDTGKGHEIRAGDVAPRHGTPPVVRVRVLGGIGVHVDGTAIALCPQSRQLIAVLAILGPGPVSRDTLMDHLCGLDYELAKGKSRVQVAINKLRTQELGKVAALASYALLVTVDEGYRLDPALVQVDVQRLFAAKRALLTATGAERRPILTEYIGLYGEGGALCGSDVPEWALPLREDLRQTYRAALLELAQEREYAGEMGGARTLYAVLVGEDPDDLAAHRAYMEFLAEIKDETALDAHYERVVTEASEDGNTALLVQVQKAYVRLRPPDEVATNAG